MANQLQLVLDGNARLDIRMDAVFEESRFRLEGTKEVLILLSQHRGAAHTIRSQEIAASLGFPFPSGETARRWVTRVIRELIEEHHIPIGGLRQPPYGYFLIVDKQDLELAVRTLRAEARSLMRRLNVLLSREQVAELWGQEMLKL